MRPPIRTPRGINEASRWTPSPRQGWLYWVSSGVVFLCASLLAGRWGALVSLVVLAVGTWLVDRTTPRKPDRDVDAGT